MQLIKCARTNRARVKRIRQIIEGLMGIRTRCLKTSEASQQMCVWINFIPTHIACLPLFSLSLTLSPNTQKTRAHTRMQKYIRLSEKKMNTCARKNVNNFYYYCYLMTALETLKLIVWGGVAVKILLSALFSFDKEFEGQLFVTGLETDVYLLGYIIFGVIVYWGAHHFLKELGLWIVGIIGWAAIIGDIINYFKK